MTIIKLERLISAVVGVAEHTCGGVFKLQPASSTKIYAARLSNLKEQYGLMTFAMSGELPVNIGLRNSGVCIYLFQPKKIMLYKYPFRLR